MLWWALAAVVGLGALFRLYNLGGAAFRADTMLFYEVGNMPLTWKDVVQRWYQLVGGPCGQFPFTMAWTKWFLDTFHIPPTHFGVRLPLVLFGILTIPVAFFCGRSLGGGRLGLVVSLLVAVNPFLIQISTEGYHYVSVVLGAFLMMWVGLDVLAWVLQKRSLGGHVYVLNAVGFFLVAYSQPSGWSYAFLMACAVLVCAGIVSWREKKVGPLLWVGGLTYLLIGMPLLLVEWGLPQIRAITTAENQAYVQRVFGSPESVSAAVLTIGPKWTWGTVWWGLALLGCGLVFGVVFCFRKWRTDKRYVMLLGAMGFGVVVMHLASHSTGASPDARYVAGYFPAFFLVLCTGIVEAAHVVAAWCRLGAAKSWVVGGAVVLAAGLQLQPAWWCIHLKGGPEPFKEAQAWFNTHLPSGTLVLVDRWFDPWCELKTYNSTNVFFTFTVPNEPVDVYLKVNWRKTARDFFDKYPDAAYFEVKKSYWDNPAVGPWDWPRTHFRHRVEFRNDAAIRLMEMGLCVRANKEELRYKGSTVFECFYNTRKDIVEIARSEGRSAVTLYAPGWGYTKLWRQVPGDFRDWRILQGTGTLDIYNLSGTVRNATVTVRGVSLNGGKKVCASTGAAYRFPQGEIVDWSIEHITLEPLENQLTLRDAGPSNSVLLVERVSVEL